MSGPGPAGHELRLFVYWHVAPAALAAAWAAMRDCQRALCASHPALASELLHRADAAKGRHTLMETYAAPGGIGTELQAEIEAQASAASAPWRQGPRHLEAFTAAAP